MKDGEVDDRAHIRGFPEIAGVNCSRPFMKGVNKQ